MAKMENWNALWWPHRLSPGVPVAAVQHPVQLARVTGLLRICIGSHPAVHSHLQPDPQVAAGQGTPLTHHRLVRVKITCILLFEKGARKCPYSWHFCLCYMAVNPLGIPGMHDERACVVQRVLQVVQGRLLMTLFCQGTGDCSGPRGKTVVERIVQRRDV